jgi:uncharacterized protein YecT (DUF1311 family)
MLKHFVGGLALFFCLTDLAYADCMAPKTDAERAQCIGQELMASDKKINDEYHQLHDALDTADQATLRHQEITWIKARAAACQVDMKESDREKWLATLLVDFNKTVCVVRFTSQRVAELQAQYDTVMRARAVAAAPPAKSETPASPSAPKTFDELLQYLRRTSPLSQDVYDVVAQRTPSAGKWYFEATIQVGEIAETSEASIFIGATGHGASSIGGIQAIRRHSIGAPAINVGIALDLDDGKLYVRRNGLWDSAPGSAGGLDLKLGRPYQAKLSSSVSLTPYLDKNLVEVNFGQRPFTYALPDGYVALDPGGPTKIFAPM